MASPRAAHPSSGWILGSARADVLAFSGPVLAALALIAYAAARGNLHADVSPVQFLLLVAVIDVGHVYATAFRVYLDPTELRRRPGLYLALPLVAYAAGVLLYAQDPMVFWRVLAYLAVFHFVRQQWGWMALARRRAGETNPRGRRLDQATIYACTLVPLIHWHTHLPAPFAWFLAGDFAPLPAWVCPPAMVLLALLLAAFLGRQLQLLRRGLQPNWAKVQVVATTFVTWYGGIVLLRSDLAFTALNVLGHGVPYLAFVWTLERRRRADRPGLLARLFRPRALLLFVAVLGLLGIAEEWTWDRTLWHEHSGLFPGPELALPAALVGLLVPLLALPQATHYLLDGWIWRSAGNPALARDLDPEAGGLSGAAAGPPPGP